MNETNRVKFNWTLKSLLLFGLTAFFLQACTAASMRVEVEVYKGPLSKTTEIQKGELAAYIKEAEMGLENFKNFFILEDLAKSKKIYCKTNIPSNNTICENYKTACDTDTKPKGCADSIKVKDIVTVNFMKVITSLHLGFKSFSVSYSIRTDAFNKTKISLHALKGHLTEATELENFHSKLIGKKNKKGIITSDEIKSFLIIQRAISSSGQNYLTNLETEAEKTTAFTLKVKAIQKIYESLKNKIEDKIKTSRTTATTNLKTLESSYSSEQTELTIFITQPYDPENHQKLSRKIDAYFKSLSSDRVEIFDKSFTEEASYLANRLKSTAFYWGSHSIFTYLDRGERKIVTDFINMASQYGNQIESRADALQKQLYPEGNRVAVPRENLALSVYLRDTRPTDFIQLYTWNRAADIEPLYDADEYLGDYEESSNKVRSFEHLFADQYWSNINTVFASGQGDVGMVFIKDEIGNWNLKSFDQDPSKILKGYTDLTTAVIKSVTEAVADGAGVGGAKASLDVLSKLAQGQLGSGEDPATEVKINQLRDDVIKELEALKPKEGEPPDLSNIKKKAEGILKKYKDDLENL